MRVSHFTLLDAAEAETPLLDYLNMPTGHDARNDGFPLESTMLLELFPPPPRYVVKRSFWERFLDRSEHAAIDRLWDIQH